MLFRVFIISTVALFIFASVNKSEAAVPQIKKVLPHLIDERGRTSLSPSLYERDAYQAFLRLHPEKRGGIRFDILWRGAGKEDNLRLRVEMRVAKEEKIHAQKLETVVKKRGWFRTWSSVVLTDKDFGEVVAWHATLWDGDKKVAEQKSFLW